jgi:hypothetical protein
LRPTFPGEHATFVRQATEPDDFLIVECAHREFLNLSRHQFKNLRIGPEDSHG